jgi:hypothetical protein
MREASTTDWGVWEVCMRIIPCRFAACATAVATAAVDIVVLAELQHIL